MHASRGSGFTPCLASTGLPEPFRADALGLPDVAVPARSRFYGAPGAVPRCFSTLPRTTALKMVSLLRGSRSRSEQLERAIIPRLVQVSLLRGSRSRSEVHTLIGVKSLKAQVSLLRGSRSRSEAEGLRTVGPEPVLVSLLRGSRSRSEGHTSKPRPGA